jgi:hypothetical protein
VLTSSFRVLRDGPGRISIARWAPRGYPAGFRVYRKLAPGDWSRRQIAGAFGSFNSPKIDDTASGRSTWIDDASFAIGYAQQLAALDPARVWHELHALAMPAEPILCCWEVPPFVVPGNWCHRRLVAAWFEEQLGVTVPEWRG